MAAGKILNDEDLEVMTRQLNIISRAIEGYYNNTTTVINSFNNEAIVQSFYSSGKFGQEKQNQLKNITEAVKKYWDLISNADYCLISQTKKFIDSSTTRLSEGTAVESGNNTTSWNTYGDNTTGMGFATGGESTGSNTTGMGFEPASNESNPTK